MQQDGMCRQESSQAKWHLRPVSASGSPKSQGNKSPPAPPLCSIPSCLWHVIPAVPDSGVRFPDRQGSAGCQVGWRCVCVAETLPGLVHPKSRGCCWRQRAQEEGTPGLKRCLLFHALPWSTQVCGNPSHEAFTGPRPDSATRVCR